MMRPRSGGYRVPTMGTRSRKIYDLMVQKKSKKQIHQILGGSYSSIGTLMWKIRNPVTANKRSAIDKKAARGRRKDVRPRGRPPKKRD